MKKHLLLFASLLTCLFASAQFTATNAPAIGDGATLYVIDSNATAYDSEVGASAVWDYSSTSGYDDGTGSPLTKTISVLDATSSTYAADYPSSTTEMQIQDVISVFYTENASSRESQGFLFEEPASGTVVKGKFSTDAETLLNFPFDYSDNLSDIYSGTVDAGTFVTGQAVDGINHVAVDGKGTLKLGQGQTFTDVLRYKLVDTATALGTVLGDVQLIRTQYEYYKFGNSVTNNLPLFVCVNIAVVNVGSTTPIMGASVILSGVQPNGFVGLNEDVLAKTAIYPNPANGIVNIDLPNQVKSANVTINDALGRKIRSFRLNNSFGKLNVSELKKGLYFVTIANKGVKSTKRLIVK